MFFRNNLLTIIWSIVIIVLCCIPGKEFPEASIFEIPHLDKIVHFTFYFILSIIGVKGISKQTKSPFLFILLYGVLLGVLIETAQHYSIPFRDGNIYDALANSLGSVLGLAVVYYKLAPNYFLLKG